MTAYEISKLEQNARCTLIRLPVGIKNGKTGLLEQLGDPVHIFRSQRFWKIFFLKTNK